MNLISSDQQVTCVVKFVVGRSSSAGDTFVDEAVCCLFVFGLLCIVCMHCMYACVCVDFQYVYTHIICIYIYVYMHIHV